MPANKAALTTQISYPRQEINDADMVITALVASVALTALTAPRTLSLPASSSYPVGLPLIISDESGACSKTNTITIRNSLNTRTITTLTRPFQSVVLRNTGSAWVFMDLTDEVLSRIVDNGPIATALALKASRVNGRSVSNGDVTITGLDIPYSSANNLPIATVIANLQNSLSSSIGTISNNLAGFASDTLTVIDSINNSALDKSKNLSELTDKSAARANLQLGSFYAALTGATYSGNVSVRGASSQGYVNVAISGQSTHTGYIEFIRADNTRIGYIGYGDANTLNIASDTGIPWNFNVAPKVTGNTVWHPGNFNPANYAALASDNTFGGNLYISKTNDAFLSIEDTSAPTNTFRKKQIYSSKNVGGGNDWLFRQTRPSDGATQDFILPSGYGGTIWTTGNFNPANYAALTGAYFTGIVGAKIGANGSVQMTPGGASNTGYIEFNGPDGVRHGYIGYSNGTTIDVWALVGAYNFNKAPLVNGYAVWHAGNFNPANYANLSLENTFAQRQFMKLGSSNISSQDNIQSFREGGLYWTSNGTAAKGWPSDGYNHLLCASYTDTNDYYSLQISGNFFNNLDFFIRKTLGGASTSTPWNKLVHSRNLVETISGDGQTSVVRFPDGTMIQGGSSVVQLDANGKKYIPLITSGTTACLPVVCNGDVNVNSNWAGATTATESGFTVYMPNSANATVRINWHAISRWK